MERRWATENWFNSCLSALTLYLSGFLRRALVTENDKLKVPTDIRILYFVYILNNAGIIFYFCASYGLYCNVQFIWCWYLLNRLASSAVDGFLFLLLGTALYNELLTIPPLMPKPDPPQQVQIILIGRIAALYQVNSGEIPYDVDHGDFLD